MTFRLSDMSSARGLIQQLRGIEDYISTTNIDPQLKHLVKLRVSQINGCAYCMSLHTEEALKDGERVDRLAVLSGWRETDWFTPRERAALLWSETLTNISTSHVSDGIYAEVREQFSEQDLADLTLAVIAINGWNRFAIPFGSPPNRFELPEREEVAAD
jgi:AhpD family alkylhydroperoxidase